MTADADILIVGGGLNGPALALALAADGFSVALVDSRALGARTEIGFDGRAYALSIASKRLLEAIGIWPTLREKAQPILQIKASDGLAGSGASPFFLSFDHAEIEEGPMGFMVEDRHLYAAFLAALQGSGQITIFAGESVVAQAVGGTAQVALTSGRQLTARLLIGCDGRGSGVATRAGIRRQGWGYGQLALVTAVRHERDHQGIAQQFFMPGGPLAILPLAGGKHSSIVWSEPEVFARAIHGLGDADYLQALRPRFGDFAAGGGASFLHRLERVGVFCARHSGAE